MSQQIPDDASLYRRLVNGGNVWDDEVYYLAGTPYEFVDLRWAYLKISSDNIIYKWNSHIGKAIDLVRLTRHEDGHYTGEWLIEPKLRAYYRYRLKAWCDKAQKRLREDNGV